MTGGAIGVAWAAVAVVWIVGALRNLSAARIRRKRDRSGLGVQLLAIAACAIVVLLGYDYLHSLAFRAAWVQLIGLALLGASTAFAIWARLVLGSMWSVGPEVGGDRRLRTDGPYAVTRHPIYTGLLGMLVGTTLLAGGHELVAFVVLGVVVFEFKLRQEERLMTATFPTEYRSYRQRVPQLVPGLRLLRRR
jgi:protein-S-isoprenylcysteine O-methyltransferase Ste14